MLCNGAIAIPFGIYWLNNPDIVTAGSTTDSYYQCLASTDSLASPNYSIQTCTTVSGVKGCLPLNLTAMSDVTTEFITWF